MDCGGKPGKPRFSFFPEYSRNLQISSRCKAWPKLLWIWTVALWSPSCSAQYRGGLNEKTLAVLRSSGHTNSVIYRPTLARKTDFRKEHTTFVGRNDRPRRCSYVSSPFDYCRSRREIDEDLPQSIAYPTRIQSIFLSHCKCEGWRSYQSREKRLARLLVKFRGSRRDIKEIFLDERSTMA